MSEHDVKMTTEEMTYAGQQSGVKEVPAPSADFMEDRASLFDDTQTDSYRRRWETIQARFVDDPQTCVREADSLVSEVTQELSRRFADEKRNLEGQWQQGSEASTEDLRQALRRFRSFFDRLLSA